MRSQKVGELHSVHGSISFDTSGQALTTNGKSDTYGLSHPFALRYRRVNGTSYETIKFDLASELL